MKKLLAVVSLVVVLFSCENKEYEKASNYENPSVSISNAEVSELSILNSYQLRGEEWSVEDVNVFYVDFFLGAKSEFMNRLAQSMYHPIPVEAFKWTGYVDGSKVEMWSTSSDDLTLIKGVVLITSVNTIDGYISCDSIDDKGIVVKNIKIYGK